ncbi:MAG: rod shape-determining protein MreD [Gammaproteobacteria bacterium]
MMFRGPGGWIILLTLLVGFTLDMIRLPRWLEAFNPEWLALVLIYWSMALPQRVGVGTAWLLGLLVDATYGVVLGQHALGLAVVVFMTMKVHRQIRVLPLWQQALSIMLFLLVQRLLVFWINGIVGYPSHDWWFLAPIIGSVLVWPMVFIVLRDLRRFFMIR